MENDTIGIKMIRNDWNGEERRGNQRRIDSDYYMHENNQERQYHVPPIIMEPPKPNPWLQPQVLIVMLFPIIAGAYTWIWSSQTAISEIQYQIKSYEKELRIKEKEDDTLRASITSIDAKIDKIKEQLVSFDSTITEIYSSNRRQKGN